MVPHVHIAEDVEGNEEKCADDGAVEAIVPPCLVQQVVGILVKDDRPAVLDVGQCKNHGHDLCRMIGRSPRHE